MKKGTTIFLQAVVVLIGLVTLALMLWEPHLEGRNAHATLFEIYFQDPFLAYAYVASLSFFVVLYQAFKILRLVRQNQTFSPATLKALRTIKYSAMTLIGFIIGAEAYIIIAMRGKDDIAGGVAVGLMLIFISAIIAASAALFERRLQNAAGMQPQDDLVV